MNDGFGQSRWSKALLVVLAIALFGVSFQVQRSLNQTRGELGLTRTEPLKNAPPLLVFSTVVLGGFRGLIANALWVRAMEMQDQGRYFEMIQLHDWITKLTPHIPTVWVVSAWNMSYNISIKFSDPAERWHWVYAGIQLLRDEALKYNPHEVEIYRELGWHFQHKLGQNLDDAHLYYKSRWASMMQEVLGGGRPDFDKLIHPPDEEWAQRARRLREEFKLDPALMKEVDEKYGPLEWRLPESHAIYWAMKGMREARTKEQLIKLRRMIYQSMQLAFYRGRLIELEWNHSVEFGPNLDLIENANAAYEEMMKEDEQMRDHIAIAHKNFLRDAVYFLYVHARLKEAERWFNYLKQKYPDKAPKGSLDDYALSRIEEDAGETSMDRTISNITGAIARSFYYLATGQDDLATGNMLIARKMYDRYTRKTRDDPKTQQRVGLPPFEDLRRTVLMDLLDPKKGLVPELAARLKTALGLPAESGLTNRPPEDVIVKPPPPESATNAPAAETGAGP